MEIRTTEQIIIDNPISRLIMMTEEQRNKNKNKKWVAVDDLIKKVDKLNTNLNHPFVNDIDKAEGYFYALHQIKKILKKENQKQGEEDKEEK